MMWIIASIPFWISGGIITLAGVAAPFIRKDGETDRDLVKQFFTGVLLGGILLVMAAKIAS